MSTVTTSNIERSPSFVAKHASLKNQTVNPIANAFASLLMAAEEGDPASTPEKSDPLADDGLATRTKASEATDAPTDAGQAALTGLLSWQALSTAGNTTQTATASKQPSREPATNDVAKLAADNLTFDTQKTASNAVRDPALTASATPNIQPEQMQALTPPASEPGDLRATSAVQTTPGTAAMPTQPPEMLVSGTEKPGASKSRTSSVKNPLPTSTTGAAGAKDRGATALQSNPGNATATDMSVMPRATVDLAIRANPEAAPDVAEGDIKQTELSPNRSEGVRMPTETGTPGTDHMHVSEHPTATLSPTEAAPTNSLATDNLTDIMDQLSGQISYWAAQGTQRASLTVSNDKDNPLEVNISMRDGEVNVAFEATQDDVRKALTTHAEALLKDMLESKGMTLGDVTVGQRPPTPDQGEATPHNRNGQNTATTVGTAPGILARSTQNGQSNLNPTPRRPDIATAQKVDLFA